MWSRKTRKHAHQYQGVTWQRWPKKTDLRTWLMTWAIRSAHEKNVRVVRVWWDVLFTETGVLAWGFSRFPDTLSCNGFLRPYLSFCFWFEFECLTVISKFQGSRTGIPSMRKPVSREIISESVEPCDTHVCFLHIQLIVTNVRVPNTHNVPPGVDFESSTSPAVSKSWNSHNLNCWTVFPTWQCYLYAHISWIQEI